MIANKCREVENTSVVSYNEEITKEKSVKKKARCKRTRGLKIGRGKVKPT
jgi:hypothetical protein